jgi:hypothetical protein
MIFSQILKLRKYTLFVKVQFWKKPTTRTAGFSSRIPYTSLHVIPLDYDNIVDEKREDRKEERLIEELQFLQDQFQIGNFYVFDTGDGSSRHALCVDALRLRDVKEIVDFSNCDLAFKKAPAINEYRCWILRYYTKDQNTSTQ